MEQKTGAKIVAAFLALIMLLSIFPYFFNGNSSNPSQDVQNNDYSDIQNDNFNVGGELIDHSFNSIADALQMSPPDTYSAQYIDVEYMNSTTAQLWNEYINPNITTVGLISKSEVDSLYQSPTNPAQKTFTRQMYFAELPDNNFLLLSTMTPKRVYFSFNAAITSYGARHQVLIRSNGGTNIMGEPTLYAPSRDNAESILSIIESAGNQITAYDTFGTLLNYSDDYSEFQVVSSQVDFADKYYLGININQDGNFTRTTIYQNPTTETSSHIKQLAGTGLARGFSQYNLTIEGDILKVVITGQFQDVINEDIEK
ncbi:MAG: hypothetical protein IBX40_04225 [Methanosarcinales archaeon]|nr:hypothetical protein [Methanosarcinales archaeon]